MIDYAQKPEYLEWAEKGLRSKFGPCSTIAVIDNRILAVAVFSNFIGHSVEFSIVSISPKWASRTVFNAFKAYAFVQLGCHRMWAVTRDDNKHAQKQLLRSGFEREGILRQHYADKTDGHIFSMLRA